ncbi:MAG: hypothetical protein HQL32_12510 [Planctomycetes bacterium]|nr:hypothetical protein [Planctomycetota bacterium]
MLEECYNKLRIILSNESTLSKQNSPSYNPTSHDFRNSFLPEQIKLQDQALEEYRITNNIQFLQNTYPDFFELIIVTKDRPGLFADIVACIYSEGLAVLDAKLIKKGELALDILTLEPDGLTLLNPDESLGRIKKKWDKICSGQLETAKLYQDRLQAYPTKISRDDIMGQSIRLKWENKVSSQYSILEIHVPARKGLLHTITDCLYKLQVSIASARISTIADNAVDVLYLTDENGNKIQDQQRMDLILKELRISLEK